MVVPWFFSLWCLLSLWILFFDRVDTPYICYLFLNEFLSGYIIPSCCVPLSWVSLKPACLIVQLQGFLPCYLILVEFYLQGLSSLVLVSFPANSLIGQ